MQFRPGVLLKMFRDARQQSLSLRWKLAVWLIMLGCTLVVLVFFVFNLIGIVNPIERQIETMLFNQLDRTVSDIRHDTDDLAAWGHIPVRPVIRYSGGHFTGAPSVL